MVKAIICWFNPARRDLFSNSTTQLFDDLCINSKTQDLLENKRYLLKLVDQSQEKLTAICSARSPQKKASSRVLLSHANNNLTGNY